MQEEEQIRLRQRNAELEVLVATLRAQLQEESSQELSQPSKVSAPSSLGDDFEFDRADPNFKQNIDCEENIEKNQDARRTAPSTLTTPALHLSEARYQALTEDHPDLICRLQIDGALTYVNEACCRYFGQHQTALLGNNFFRLLFSDALPFSLSSIESVIQYEHHTIDGNGRECWHQWTQCAIYNQQGDLVEFQAIGRDISDRKLREVSCHQTRSSLEIQQPRIAQLEREITQLQAEIAEQKRIQESLQASEERCRSVFNAMREGVFLLSPDGTIQACNGSAERIFECDAEDLVSYNILDLPWQIIHEDGSAFYLEDFPGIVTAKTGNPCSTVVMGLCKSAKRITWISVNAQPLSHDRGSLPHAVVVSFSDITPRKWIDEERTLLLEREQIARAEAELAREQISQVLQSITDGFIAFDRESRFTYINHEAARTLGRPARDLLGKFLWKEFPHLRETSFGRLYRRAVAEGVPLELIDHYQPCDRWYSVRAYPSKAGISLYFRNMTDSVQVARERDRAQEALRETLQRLSFHVDNSPFAVIEWDRHLRVTRWSREAEHLLGWSAEQVLGRRFGAWKLIFPEDIEIVDRTIAELLNGRATRNVCYSRNYTKDGRIVHCEWYNSVLFDEAGELVSVLSLVLNISDRKQAEAELRDSEERFRQLAENIQQMFWMYDVEEKNLIYISPVCQQVVGYNTQSCYNKTLAFWLNHVRQEDLPQVLRASRQVVRGTSVEVMYRFRKSDGNERWVLARAFPVRNGEGRVYRIAGIAEDITDRKEQEQRLRLLESVIVNANDAVVITEAEPVEPPGPKIIYVNEAFTRMMGYRPEEVIGKTPRILQGPKTDWNALKDIRIALKDWRPALAELVNYHKDGSEIWIELSIFPVSDQTGHYTYWVGLQRDISHRKQTEQDLQRQNWRSQLFADITLKIRQSLQLEEILQTTVTEVRNLLQADRVLIYRLQPDQTGVVSHEAVSANWESLLGRVYPNEVFLSDPCSTNPNSIQILENIDQEAIVPHNVSFLREIGVRAELVVLIVQQESLWGLLIVHQCDEPRQWSSFETELLEQLANQVEIALTQSQLLQALRESEERFRTMANSAPVLLWVTDTAGGCVFCNQSLLNFTGRTLEQERGIGWYETVHPADISECHNTYQQAIATRSSFKIEYRLRRSDGEYRWVLDQGVPRFMPDGHFGGHIGSCIDITDRKQAEVEMQKALEKERELSELKSQFVSTASHEFRTPLSTILSSADMLEFYVGNATLKKQMEHIQRIQNAALNMKDLLSDVLVLERADAKKLKFEPASLNLLSFCQNLTDEMRLNDQDHHCLVFEPQEQVQEIRVWMDGKLLRQIFTNLISNALKYSPAGSKVSFRLHCNPDFADFEVQDEGIGIPAEDQNRLFEPFHRGMNVGTIAGNGLGLAIVKQSVDVHQGHICVISQENQGTIVQVTLPRQCLNRFEN